MSGYANQYSGVEQQGAQEYGQRFGAHQQVTQDPASGSSNDYYQQSGARDQAQTQRLGQRYDEQGQGQYNEQGQQFRQQGQQYSQQEQQYGRQEQQEQQYSQQGQGHNVTAQHNQQFQGQQQNVQHQTGQTYGNQAGQQQLGAGEPPEAAQQDSLHKFLDKIEKKFGGERFNNPANYEKNKKLNDSLILKLKQVMKVVMQKGPSMIKQMMH